MTAEEAHRKDGTSAPETDFVQELKQDLEFVSSIEGSAQKKQVALYCRRLGIDYTKLTEIEFEVMMRVLQKSKATPHKEKCGIAPPDFSSDETKTAANTVCIREDFCKV